MAAASSPPPTLEVDDLRVDVDGVPTCDGLTFQTHGTHVLVLGAPRALFEATTGMAAVMRGRLLVRGTPVGTAAASGLVAGAALDPPLPPSWTVAEYVEWSARLAGVPADLARARVTSVLAELSLDPMAKMRLSKLVPHARRASVVAAALVTGADVLALEDPLGGLPDDVAHAYAEVLVKALASRSWLVFAPRMPLASPLALDADDALVVSATGVESQGTPSALAAAGRRFVARLDGRADVLASTLSARGVRVEAQGAHLLLDLGDTMTTSELMGICATAEVSVLSLVPVARALS